jgi:pimeloyl-ACP methyl ester carboxylesterase
VPGWNAFGRAAFQIRSAVGQRRPFPLHWGERANAACKFRTARKALILNQHSFDGLSASGIEERSFVRRVVVVLLTLLLSFAAAGSNCFQATAENLKPRVIVFVHGLHGSRDTWRAPNGAYWPQLIQTDPQFRNSDVVVAEYPTPSARGQLSTVQLADILWQGLNRQKVWEHQEVVFIAHSLGGLLTEEMLLNHPADATRVSFIVSYATPHQGSFIASLAKIYDSDPLLSDLRDGNDNSFLIDLEQKWRSTPSAARIHRYCAYEALDTPAGAGIGHYLRAHARVVSYYSATYGCDVDTAPQKIVANHIDIVKPASRSADAYTFFALVYRKNPILNVVDSVRDSRPLRIDVDCNHTNSADDLEVPVALNPVLHEQILSATAELVDTARIRDVSPPAVTKIDPVGIVHISYSFKGQGRGLLMGCPAGHASLVVHFHIRSQVPLEE